MSETKISDFTYNVVAALSSCSLYSEKHPIVSEFSEKALRLLKDLYRDGFFSITLLGDSLVFNDKPVTGKNIHFDNLAKRLKRKGIEKIEIRNGVTIDEFKKFIAGMASKETFLTSPHISVGIVEMRLRSGGASPRELIDKHISKIKGVFQGASYDTGLDTGTLEEAVLGLISTLKQEANVLSAITPVKTYSEYTYVHATNVSVLAIFQAETFGINSETIYDVGLAGLLHDVGKIFVPKEVLDKQTKLELNEWNAMKLHPVYGARYLSALPDIPKLAIIVAYEHHMKFDGSGYPDAKQASRRQHLISQMVAIADFFDALRTERPYRKPLDIGSVVKLIHEGVGKDFNPVLVDNFIGALRDISAI